jgi:hypothetical protein
VAQIEYCHGFRGSISLGRTHDVCNDAKLWLNSLLWFARRRRCDIHMCECSYSEAHEAEGPVDAMLGAIGHSIVHLFTTVPFLRAIVIPILPKPGDGPPEAYREKNHWKFTLYGFTAEEPPAKGRVCQVCAPAQYVCSRFSLQRLSKPPSNHALKDIGTSVNSTAPLRTGVISVLKDGRCEKLHFNPFPRACRRLWRASETPDTSTRHGWR